MLAVTEQDREAFFTMFPVFSVEERRKIRDSLRFRTYKKGEVIFSEGEQPTGLICLSQGKAKVYKKGISGKEQIVRLARPLSLLGFQAFLANDSYASAKTLEQSVVCIMPSDCVETLIKANTAFAHALLQYVSRALRFSDMRLLALTQKHIRARMADSLLLVAEAYGLKEDGQTLCSSISRDDLAKLSNMTASNATRTLTNFHKEGLIRLGEHRTILLLNIPALTRISHHG